jgi:hypothetical protein
MTRILAIGSLLLAACAGASGTTTIDSTVPGFATATLPAITSAVVTQCRSQTSYGLGMVFGQTVSTCSNLSIPASGPWQRVQVGIANGPAPLAAGKYPITFLGTAGVIGAAVTAAVSDGFTQRSWRANSGTLTIDAVDGDAFSGSFEASGIVEITTNPAGDPVEGTLTGRFSGSGCHMATEICL